MEKYVLYYTINSLTEPTRMREKTFTEFDRARAYYNACRADWYGKALKEFNVERVNYRPKFSDYFTEVTNPSNDVLCEFFGEVGWTRYSFSLERI